MKNDLSTNQTIVNVQCDQMLEQKAAQMFPKVTQEVATAVLHKCDVFQNSPISY